MTTIIRTLFSFMQQLFTFRVETGAILERAAAVPYSRGARIHRGRPAVVAHPSVQRRQNSRKGFIKIPGGGTGTGLA